MTTSEFFKYVEYPEAHAARNFLITRGFKEEPDTQFDHWDEVCVRYTKGKVTVNFCITSALDFYYDETRVFGKHAFHLVNDFLLNHSRFKTYLEVRLPIDAYDAVCEALELDD
jgi:hypothetical protein